MRNFLSRLIGCGLAIALALFLLAALIDGAGTSPALMLSMFHRHAPAGVTGLPETEYPGMAAMITGYLSGEAEQFQYTWTDASGVTYLAFQPHEQQHMADCLALFQLCRRVALLSLLAVCLCLGAGVLLRDWRRVGQGAVLGGSIVLGALALLGIGGLIDFDGLFVLFHRISFDNGLWLLNPATDLLIRLMPIGFFIHYAALLGGTWLIGILLGLLILRRAMKHPHKRSE